ncbi:MAG: TGS domain-containing protein, partial [Candidatus Angelobacter sp.]
MAQNIQVTLPDGSKKEVPRGTTPLDIARSISPRLADAALVAKVKPSAAGNQTSAPEPDADAKTPASMHAPAAKDGWQFADLSQPLEEDVDLRLLTDRDPEALHVYRHSSAHLLATAVLELFPETKLGHGPPTDTGFFYDFFRPTPFTPEDLEKIEKRMGEVAERDEKFEREFLPRNAGLARFRSEGDFMKVHFIEQFTRPGDPISIYRNGKFVDFCRGPHVPSTGRIKAFKLTSIAGAYWLGDEKNPQLQRIYGTS